jgi:hypothetical protein
MEIQNELYHLLMASHQNVDLSLLLQFSFIDTTPLRLLYFDSFDRLIHRYRRVNSYRLSILESNDSFDIAPNVLFIIINLFEYLRHRKRLFIVLDIFDAMLMFF